MNQQIIKYNYHDAYIEGIQIEDGTVHCFIVLYSIYYPEAPTVKVSFSGIYNETNVLKYFQSILNDAEPNGEIGCGIEILHMDEKMKSLEGDLYIFLKTQWEGTIRIHCSEFIETQ